MLGDTPALASTISRTVWYRNTFFLLLFPLRVEMFNVCMDVVVPEVNARVLGKGLELLSMNGGRIKKKQLLFADGTALVADSGEVV